MLICPLIHGRSWCKSNGIFITLQVLTYAGTRRFSTIIMLKPVLPTWRSSLTDNRGEKWLIKGRRCYQCMHTWGRSRPSHSADDTTKFNAYAHDPSHHTHTIPCLHEKDDTGEATRLERKTSAEIFTATTKHAHARTRTHVLALGRQGKDFGIVWQRHILKQLPLWGKRFIVSSQEELFITIFFTCLLLLSATPFLNIYAPFLIVILSVQARLQRGMKIHDTRGLVFFLRLQWFFRLTCWYLLDV